MLAPHRSVEETASAAVTAELSWNLYPSLIVKLYSVPDESRDHSLSASGIAAALVSSNANVVSYTWPPTPPLKVVWHAQSVLGGLLNPAQ